MAVSTASLEAIRQEVIACTRCPRLVEHREGVAQTKKPRYAEWEYWGRPVPGFGDSRATVFIVGLAPAAHGGNRTGRVFTGDPSASFLMRALHAAGFANQPTSEHRNDGLVLHGAYIAAAVRCVPPKDRPTPHEQRACLPYLVRELDLLPNVKAVLALGRIAFQSCLWTLGERAGTRVRAEFAHGRRYDFGPLLPTLVASYHPSPRNTNTGRLTYKALEDVLLAVREVAGIGPLTTQVAGRDGAG